VLQSGKVFWKRVLHKTVGDAGNDGINILHGKVRDMLIDRPNSDLARVGIP
jgi:hypothetical protein